MSLGQNLEPEVCEFRIPSVIVMFKDMASCDVDFVAKGEIVSMKSK